jgi:mannose/cellobiose epimerase-like protein (N-acyl-D-glucosamine 2-epimerase family)
MINMTGCRSETFLKDHIASINAFYHPRATDTGFGGFFHEYHDDGRIGDRKIRHLVSSCRFVYNFATAAVVLDDPSCLKTAQHGLDFLNQAHLQSDGGYAWILSGRDVVDGTRHCYGHAFVLLAHAAASKAGLAQGTDRLGQVFDLLERRFFLPKDGLYSDEIADGDWSAVSDYRGQNANMHMCEAMIAAFEASGERRYLDRALLLARRVCADLADRVPGRKGYIWEHYKSDWSHDWDYNRDDPHNLFRTYGYVLGHFTEWAKLLMILHRYAPEDWMLERAAFLFDTAMDISWDEARGGMRYTIWPDGRRLDDTRFFWVHAETIAAAALLALGTGDEKYWRWYDRFWAFADAHLVDHRYGGWFRMLDADNRRIEELKSPTGKTDYHGLGACYEVLRALEHAGRGKAS